MDLLAFGLFDEVFHEPQSFSSHAAKSAALVSATALSAAKFSAPTIACASL
jgi:hypothetical protein